MPRVKKSNSPRKPTVKELSCASCGKLKKSNQFYTSYSKIHQTGLIPYCKDCLKTMVRDDNGNIDLNKLKSTLQLIDRPFLSDIWDTSLKEDGEVFGIYMKNIQMQQYRYLTWKDSINSNIQNYEYKNTIIQSQNNFQITDEIILKWGAGYQLEEYQSFERKYEFLKNNYPEKTSMHTEALLKYIRYSVKEEMATAANDVGAAKSWGQLAKDAATAAKINPSQLSAADLQDGLSTFGQLARAVEQAVDIIPILPRFKERPQDKVDFTLWCYINYIRDLKGLPLCEYKDIWKFYEERKKEYENRFEFLQDKEELLEEGVG